MSSGGGPDRIFMSVGAEIDNSSISKIAIEFARQLKVDLERALKSEAATIGRIEPIVSGREVFEEGGRKFEITGKAKRVMGPEDKLVPQAQIEIKELTEEQAKLDRIQKQIEIEQRRARQKKRKEFLDEFNLAQAQLKFEKSRSEKGFLPVEGLEANAAKFRTQIDTQQRQIDENKRKQFLEDFDLAQKEVKHSERQAQRAKKSTEDFKKRQFQDFRRSTMAIDDPSQQVVEIERFLGTATGKYLEEGKIFRQRVMRNVKINADQAAREQRLRFQNTMLGVASAGIGIFGTAGFPLLNIGFAAMSGGPVGAGIAIVTTAIGEFTRAINALSESAKGVAKEIGFVSTNFKLVEARSKAISAFAGFGKLASEAAGMEIRNKKIESFEGQKALRLWGDIGSTLKTQWTDMWMNILNPSRFGGQDIVSSWNEQRKLSLENTSLENLQSARRNMIMQMSQGGPGVETDPYQVWVRMQNAALDFSKQEEMRISQEYIKSIDKQIAAMEANTEALKSAAPWIPEHIRRIDPSRVSW